MLVTAYSLRNKRMLQSTITSQYRQISSLGFTLVELLFTIAIAGIFSALAAPSFRDFIAGQRMKAASSDISSTLTGARSEALKRNLNVVLTPSSGGWQNGWTVVAGVGGPTVGQHEAFSDLTIAGPSTNITYNSSGRLVTAVTPFTVSSSMSGTVAPRCISIDLSGLPTSKTGAC